MPDAGQGSGATPVEVRLLGEVEAARAGRPVLIGSARQRALLAILALRLNRPVSAEELIDALWGEAPPPSARSTLHSLVSRLRAALGEGRPTAAPLLTHNSTYRLDGDPELVDALQFVELGRIGRAAMADGDPDAAATTLRSALGLWRGAALGDLREYATIRHHADRLDDARLRTTEDLAEAELACGRPVEALEEAEAVVSAQPLRERAWAAIMLAQYRLGRPADALESYRNLRDLLAEQLGSDPTPELADLQLRIIRHDPALGGAATRLPPRPPELGTTGLPFAGRSGELASAHAFLTDPERQRAGVVWVLGEPGIGKTRLADELATRSHAEGALVLFGRCNEELAVPYQPFIEALRWFVSVTPEPELGARLGAMPGELARLVPELTPRLRTAPASLDAVTSPELAQHHLFEAVRSWLTAAGGGGPVLLLVDDAHWAAPATLALLGHVLRSAAPARLVVVATARTVAPDASDALAALAENLRRSQVPNCRLPLSGLGRAQVGELLMHAVGRDLDPALRSLASALHEETAGHPLYVEGVLATLREDGRWDPAELPGSLAESIRVRLRRLPPTVGELLEIAAVAGAEFDVPVLARAAGKSEAETLAALESASGAGLVEEVGADRYRFTHGLLRAALSSRLTHSRGARVHLGVGRALEEVHADTLVEHFAALAHHFQQAGGTDAGARGSAYRYALLAAEHAGGVLAHRDAADAYATAIELLPHATPGEAVPRGALLLPRGRAQGWAGEFTAARATLAEAAADAASRGAAEELAEAAVAFDEASVFAGLGGPETLRFAETAAEALPRNATPLRALTLAALARALHFAGRREDSRARAREATELARELGDPDIRAVVMLRGSMYARRRVADAAEQTALGAEIRDLYRGRAEDGDVLLARGLAAEATARMGDLTEWNELLELRAERLAVTRRPYYEHALLMRHQISAMLAGDLALAQDLLRRAEDFGASLEWDFDGVYAFSGVLLRREQGRLPALAPVLRLMTDTRQPGSLWAPGLAFVYAELGMFAEARTQLDRLAEAGGLALPDDDIREAWAALLAEACAAVGDGERAGFLHAELVACEGRLLLFPVMGVCLGPADRLLGALDALRGDAAAATRRLTAAVAFSRGLPSPLWTARCLYDLGTHLAPTAPVDAAAALFEAQRICAVHGLAGLAPRVSAALAGLGSSS